METLFERFYRFLQNIFEIFYFYFHIAYEVALPKHNKPSLTSETSDTLITNILVEGIGEDILVHDLKKYFENFGEVTSLTFNDNDLYNSRSANVLFMDAKAAAKVLAHEGHKDFTVAANDVWLQPLSAVTTQQDFTNQSKYLTDLDDDTLLKIISYMDVRDQLAFALSHARFSNVFEMFAKVKLKEVATTTNLSPLSAYQIQQYFIVAGEYIQIFGLIDCHKNSHLRLYMQLLTIYCPNLKVLLVSDLIELYAENLNKILSSNSQLKALFLHQCDIKDECSTAISNLSHLELLSIHGCQITGRDLFLPNLKQLHMINCDNFNQVNMPALSTLGLANESMYTFDAHIFANHCKNLEALNTNCSNALDEVLAKLKKLRSINISNTCSEDYLSELIQKGGQIQSLGIDCKYFYEDDAHLFSHLNNLRTLRLFNANDDILKAMLCEAHKMHNLMEIDLSYRDYDAYEDMQITNQGLLALVAHCKNLKRLKIDHTNINHEFVEALLPLIKETKRLSGQLEIFVYGSPIKKDCLPEEYFSEDMKSLVKFVFEESKTPFNGTYKNFFEYDFFLITLPEL